MKINKFTNRIAEIWDYPKPSKYDNEAISREGYFEFLKEKPKSNDIRLYIHIPYCMSFCSFCQFFKEPYPKEKDKIYDYFECVKAELEYYSKTKYFQESRIVSIFFGGGDPAIIPNQVFDSLMNCIYENFMVDEDISITIEGNVRNLLDYEKLNLYAKHKVTRISFGIQTFDEELRKKFLIKPTLEQIYRLTKMIKEYPSINFAFDIIYNFPDQTNDILLNDIKMADSLNPEYIDFFSLNLYPNTRFYKDIYERGRYEIPPNKKIELEQNKLIQRQMSELGYRQVISSTYSKVRDLPNPGMYHFLCNRNTLGIGPSARSYLDGHAFRNICSIEEYCNLINSNEFPIDTGKILSDLEIDHRAMVNYANLLKIPQKLVEKYEDTFDTAKQLVELGYLSKTNTDYIVTEEGKAWVGNIQKCFFSKEEAEKDMKNFLLAVKSGQSAYNQDYMLVQTNREV